MRAAAERLQAGDLDARTELVRSALDSIALLRQHITKEENVLFRMAEQKLQGPDKEALSEAFARVELEETGEGVHERFLALAASIERQVTELRHPPAEEIGP